MTHCCLSTPLPPWQQLPPCLSWSLVGIFAPTCSEDPAPVPKRKLVLSFPSSEQNLLCILLQTFMPILGCFPLSAFDVPLLTAPPGQALPCTKGSGGSSPSK